MKCLKCDGKLHTCNTKQIQLGTEGYTIRYKKCTKCNSTFKTIEMVMVSHIDKCAKYISEAI